MGSQGGPSMMDTNQAPSTMMGGSYNQPSGYSQPTGPPQAPGMGMGMGGQAPTSAYSNMGPQAQQPQQHFSQASQ